MLIKKLNIKNRLKLIFTALILVLSTFSLKAQTFVTAPLTTSTLAPGQYYNNTGIVLGLGFSANGVTGAYRFYTSSNCFPLTTNLSTNQNYILTSTPRISGIINATGLANQGTCQLMQTIQYFDGLGRALQTIQIKGSPSGNDVVQPIAYDQFGRQSVKYLPYASTTADGSYKANALTAGAGQAAFYTSPPAGVSPIPYPSASTGFEVSPLNRVVEQGSPGAPWQLSTSGVSGSGHAIKIAYSANAATDVILWTVNSAYNGATGNSYYAAGQLYATTTTDENGNNTIAYKDIQGKVVCKKAESANTPLTYLATYYVYDDLNNLIYVIPPIPSGYPASFLETDAVFNNYIYGYHYDGRGRIMSKKIPGKGLEEMVYNLLDQVIFSRDANQLARQEWGFNKYDALGRVIMTGVEQGNLSTQAALQSYVTNTLKDTPPLFAEWETPVATGGVQGYTNNAFPNNTTVAGDVVVPLVVSYYDNYSFPGNPYTATASGLALNTRGLLTGTKTAVLNTDGSYGTMLYSTSYYDGLGRDIETLKEHYLGGTNRAANAGNYDDIVSAYDFSNEVIATTRRHYTTAGTTPAVTIGNSYYYDHVGRKIQTWESITVGSNAPATAILLSQEDYNEVGQVMTKHLHSANNGASFLQNTSYAYNERGWLLKINDPTVSPTSTQLFAEQLNYNITQYSTTPQFNGNIAESAYNAGISGQQYNTYTYDPLNRLTSGTNSAGFSETGITYDNMGNVTALSRTGPNAAVLSYAYTDVNNNSTGNQLQAVTNNGTTALRSYGYDANGNATGDGTNTFTYNMLNLPKTVTAATATPAVNMAYIYDADGNKLRKISGLTTDYISGIQYSNGAIAFIQTEEGRAINTGGSSYNYEYTLTDHLGNNRVTFDMVNGKVGEDDYYPFGLNVPRQVNATNYYLYNKKELQPELTEYDYGARFYNPVIARWNVPDPDAENYEHTSPYAYVLNNPINLGDVDGRDTVHHLKEVFIHGTKPAPKPEPIEVEPLKEIKPIEYGVFIKPPVFLMPILTLVFVLMPANYDDHEEADNLRLMNARRDPKHPGSYTIKFKNGKRYHGKGPFSRALESAKRIAKLEGTTYDIQDIDWTPSTSNEQSFRDEAKRLEADGGKNNPNNYNQIDSPGSHKYKQDQ